MTGNIEKVYSEALFELAVENGTAEDVNRELAAVSEIFSANGELYEILSAPTVTDDEKTEMLTSIFGGRISDLTLDFLCLTAQKGRIRNLQGIADAFRELLYNKDGIVEVTVTTVKPLKSSQRDALKSKLEQKYGKKVIMAELTDPAVMGGVVIQCGDTLLDGSVRTKLDNMRRQLENVIA